MSDIEEAVRSSTTSDEKRRRWLLLLVLCVHATIGVAYALMTPWWQIPDEPAHFNYVKYIAENGKLPELRVGDYPQAYLEEIKARRFDPTMSIDSIRYESHQPPLFYAVAAVVYRLTAGAFDHDSPIPIRLFSLAIGVASLAFGYHALRAMRPDRPMLALSAIAFSASIPMHVALTAAVNNDALAELLLAALAWQLLKADRNWSKRKAVTLGVLLGLAFLTKMQSYVGFGIAGLSLLWDTLPARRSMQPRKALTLGVIMYGTAAALAVPWLVRNALVYGAGDPLGLARHAHVVRGQLTTADYAAEHGWLVLVGSFAGTSFRSFWGQFGWMGVLMHRRVYDVLALLSGSALAGLLLRVRAGRGCVDGARWRHRSELLLLGAWVGLTLLGYLWWNTKYVQHQGRYLFPALLPIGLAFVIGIDYLLASSQTGAIRVTIACAVTLCVVYVVSRSLDQFTLGLLVGWPLAVLAGQWVRRRFKWLPLAALYCGLNLFAIACLFVYIVPNLAP